MRQYLREKKLLAGILAGSLFAALFLYDFKLMWLIFPILVFTLILEDNKEKSWFRKWHYVTLVMTIVVFLMCLISLVNKEFFYSTLFGEQIFRLNTFSYVLLFVVGIGFVIFQILTKIKMAKLQGQRYVYGIVAILVAVMLFLGGINAVRESTIRSDDPCYNPEDDFDWEEHFQYPTYSPTAFNDVARWAFENSAKDALFLVPVECGDFRNVAKRSIFVDFKYGTMSTFSVDFGLKWFERVHALNPDRKSYYYNTFYVDFIADYRNLTEARVRDLDDKYGLDYAVFEKGKEMSFPVVYENSEYVVYDLR